MARTEKRKRSLGKLGAHHLTLLRMLDQPRRINALTAMLNLKRADRSERLLRRSQVHERLQRLKRFGFAETGQDMHGKTVWSATKSAYAEVL